jgi:hypothetical protein
VAVCCIHANWFAAVSKKEFGNFEEDGETLATDGAGRSAGADVAQGMACVLKGAAHGVLQFVDAACGVLSRYLSSCCEQPGEHSVGLRNGVARGFEGEDGPEKEAEESCADSTGKEKEGLHGGDWQRGSGIVESDEVDDKDDDAGRGEWVAGSAEIGEDETENGSHDERGSEMSSDKTGEDGADAATDEQDSDGLEADAVGTAIVDDDAFEGAKRTPADGEGQVVTDEGADGNG